MVNVDILVVFINFSSVIWDTCVCVLCFLNVRNPDLAPFRSCGSQMVPYKIVKAPNGDAWVEVSLIIT